MEEEGDRQTVGPGVLEGGAIVRYTRSAPQACGVRLEHYRERRRDIGETQQENTITVKLSCT